MGGTAFQGESVPREGSGQPWPTVAYSYPGEVLTTTKACKACTANHVSAIRDRRGCDAARSQNGLFGIQLNAKQLRSGVRFFDRPVVIQVSPPLVVVAHVDETRYHPFEQHYLPKLDAPTSLDVLVDHNIHVGERMEEGVKDWAVVHHATAEKVALVSLNDSFPTDHVLVYELDGH
jgi:hypothetical protein